MLLEPREKVLSCTNGLGKIISSLLPAVHLILISGRGSLETDCPAESALHRLLDPQPCATMPDSWQAFLALL